MTDVSNLDNLAAAIATSSKKIRDYAIAQAAATQAQEVDIAKALALQTQINALDARLDALENPNPPPPPPPPGPIIPAPANLATLQANAVSGAVIRIGAGNHGNQTFTLTKTVKFLAEPGAILGDVTFACGSGGIELSGFQAGAVSIGTFFTPPNTANWPAPASDITLRNIDGRRWNINYGLRIRIYGGDWGLSTVQQTSAGILAPSSSYDGNHVPTDILIDGGYYHDFGMPNLSGTHTAGIQAFGCNGVVIRNCTFDRIGGTGSLSLFYLDPQYITGGWQWPASAWPPLQNFRIYGNKSLDLPGEFSQGTQYFAFFDVQCSSDIPGMDYTMLQAQNIWPRGVRLGSDSSIVPVALPNPPAPPNWPPA